MKVVPGTRQQQLVQDRSTDGIAKKSTHFGKISDASHPHGVLGEIAEVVGCQLLKFSPGLLLETQLAVDQCQPRPPSGDCRVSLDKALDGWGQLLQTSLLAAEYKHRHPHVTHLPSLTVGKRFLGYSLCLLKPALQ